MLSILMVALGGAGTLAALAVAAWAYARREIHRATRDADARLRATQEEVRDARRTGALRVQEERIALEKRSQEAFGREKNELSEYAVELAEREKLLDSREDQARSVAAGLDTKAEEIESIERQAARLRSEAEVRQSSQLQRLEERSGWTRSRALKQRVRDRVSRTELALQKRLSQQRQWLEQNAVMEARRQMAAAVDRYNGVGHLERIQNSIPIADAATREALSDPNGRAHQIFRADIGCELWSEAQSDALTVRSDDPLAREIARRVLRQLANRAISDPDRVRNIVVDVRNEVEREVQNAARKAIKLLDLGRMHPEVLQLVGRLKFRLSYSQNQWKHAIEVAYLAGMMAEELGEDVRMARRGGLLHDIGKAMTHDHEGSHAVLGAQVARRCGEHEIIANAIGSHHNDEPPNSAIAHIVTAADALSGARPGARRENATSYMGRLQEIQRIASSFRAVERVDIMHAGREVRIVVAGDERGDVDHSRHGAPAVLDSELYPLAQQVARTLEEEVTYAGQIRVTVIRESRSVAIAR